MGSMQMKQLCTFFGKKIYYANSNFIFNGLFIWTGKTNLRIIPFNKFKNWTAKHSDE